MEREYSRLRQAETRHRLLFQVIGRGRAGRRRDQRARSSRPIRPPARLLGRTPARLVGRLLPEGFDADERARRCETLLGPCAPPAAPATCALRLADGAGELHASASLFREERAFVLPRPARRRARGPRLERIRPRPTSRVLEVVERSPDGFVVTDLDGRIVFANRAFLDMVQLATEEQARGEPLERWLGRPGVDFDLLTAHLREHGSVRLFATDAARRVRLDAPTSRSARSRCRTASSPASASRSATSASGVTAERADRAATCRARSSS